MAKIDFRERFRRLAFAPMTKSGTPLFRKHPNCETGAFTDEQNQDEDFKTESDKRFTSPKNIRAIFVGINRSVVVHHRGFASVGKEKEGLVHGEKIAIGKVYNKNDKGKYTLDLVDVKPVKDEEGKIVLAVGERVGQNDDGSPKFRYEKIDNYSKPPLNIFRSNADAVLNNVEEIYFDITAIMDADRIQNLTSEYIIGCIFGENEFKTKGIEGLRDRFPRLQRVGLVMGMEAWLKNKGEEAIRELAKDKELIGDRLQGSWAKKKIFNIENPKDDFKLIKAIWWYDEFLDSLRAEERKQEAKNKFNGDKEENYKLLNDHFVKLYARQNGGEFMKRTDYTVKCRLGKVGEKIYNKLEDCSYTVKEGQVVLVGTQGEESTTSKKNVVKTYEYQNEEGIFGELTEDKINYALPKGYLELRPKANNQKVFVYQVLAEQKGFAIKTSWGDVLKINQDINSKGEKIEHGKGDWVLCDANEQGKPKLDDQKVVNGIVFEKTYEPYKENKTSKTVNDIIIHLKKLEEKGEFDKMPFSARSWFVAYIEKDNELEEYKKEFISAIGDNNFKEDIKKAIIQEIEKINK